MVKFINNYLRCIDCVLFSCVGIVVLVLGIGRVGEIIFLVDIVLVIYMQCQSDYIVVFGKIIS